MLVDTSEQSFYFGDKKDMVQKVRMILCEELAAVNTYESLASNIRSMGRRPDEVEGIPRALDDRYLSVEDAKRLAEFVDEIRNDELNHVGKLQAIIDKFDATSREETRKGKTGA